MQLLRIASWNCNGGLRRKTAAMDALKADLLIVQEAEDPTKHGGAYLEWAGNHLWHGDNRNKGILVCARANLPLKQLVWPDGGTKLFLPFSVQDGASFIAVWTKYNKAPTFGYIGQFWKYWRLNREQITKQPVLAVGDFNANAIWHKPRRSWNFSDVARELAEAEIHGLYVRQTGEPYGAETAPTFMLRRDRSKPYHIDHAFAHESLIPDDIDFQVGKVDDWLPLSDHMPISFNLRLSV